MEMAVKAPILIFCRIKRYIHEHLQEIQGYVINGGAENDILTIYHHQVNNVVNNKPDFYNFQFAKVFDQEANQELIYETVAKPVVHSALNGYNGTIFAYGQTGSGKTYTISGEKENQGIVPRALHDIFSAITNIKEEKFEIKMSYLEIYNEQSNDLLIPVTEEKKKILLRENYEKVMEWHNLTLCPVQSFSEAMELLTVGENNRIVCDTPMNIYSSRSHTILTIYITSHIKDSLEIRRAKLNLVDLAGSERVHKTGEEGIVLEEARHINLSLHYLEQVIVALSDTSRTHVPYRNCTMTSALRDSLGGNCMTVMVANIAMDKANLEETVSTCRFAQRAALIHNELQINSERDLKSENNQLKEEIQQLKRQCSSLQEKVQEIEKRNAQTKSMVASPTEDEVTTHYASIKPPPSNLEGLSVQQLQTDIIYLIGWLQDELKKQGVEVPGNDDTALSSYSVLSTVTSDKDFNSFITTVKAEEDWMKAKSEEQKAAEDLVIKVDTITSVHQDILNWWKHHNRSAVREMLSDHTLQILGSECISDTTAKSPTFNHTVEKLLNTHSDLLKDVQLLKSRLRSSKRSIQRIKRKYSVEYNDWKKGEKTSLESFSDKIDTLNVFEHENKREYLEIYDVKKAENIMKISDITIQKCKLSPEKNTSNYTSCSSWNAKDVLTGNFDPIYDSDLNTTFSDVNDSVFSTSTSLSATRLTIEYKPRRLTKPLLARSMSCSLETSTNHSHSRQNYSGTREEAHPFSHSEGMPTINTFQLTGEDDVDDEIIAFYTKKAYNNVPNEFSVLFNPFINNKLQK